MTKSYTLFPTGSDNSSSRWIVMNDIDVRMCLATGVVPLARELHSFAPYFNPPEKGWRWIDANGFEELIPVQNVRRACVVHLPNVITDGDFLSERVPASLIESIAFTTEQVGNDWVARSASFEGLPGKLPRAKVCAELKFTESETTSDPRSKTTRPPTERDRVAGALSIMLAHNNLSPKAIGSLCKVSVPDRPLILDLIRDTVPIEPTAVRLCFEILSDPAWHGGFDELKLLDAFRACLEDVIKADVVLKWANYVDAVLKNRRDAGNDTLLDEGDILLRALQLILRTTPLTVREIDNQIATRGNAVGPKVGQLSRVFAAWYEGFGALTGAIKTRPEIYSIGSRAIVGSGHYPLNFKIERRKDQAGFCLETLLLENDCKILSHVERPAPEFMEAYYATESVCNAKGWTLSYNPEQGHMQIAVGDLLVSGHLIASNEICWWAGMAAGKRPRARTWPKGFLESVLKIASDFRCTVASVNGFPNLEFKSYQLLGTMDRDEVSFHIEAIKDAMEQIGRLPLVAPKMK